MRSIDNIDFQILNLLQKDARIAAKEIANKLNLTITPIYERIKKLEKLGYIKKYIALVDNKKIDKGLIIFISVSLSRHTKDIVENFIKEIKKLNEVMECYYISGNADFLLKVYCKDMQDYHNFITNKFSVIENITQFYSSFVMSEAKIETAFKLI
ncbi:MAG: Lrp/AsnC family transcriptional regulator [Bacteroidales bacterium]|nr:Lrp/AsnC family transcriptional regulator [Bacteroidales bacterium]